MRSFWEDLALLAGLGITAVVAYNNGKKDAYREVAEQNRDMEILRLRQELNDLKSKVPPSID